MILTDKAIRSSKPRDSVYRLREVGGGVKGFGVTIAPAGSKTFFLGYTAPGSAKRTQINLGRYPATGLKDARQRAYEAREALSRGIDPRDQVRDQAIVQEAHVDVKEVGYSTPVIERFLRNRLVPDLVTRIDPAT